MNLLEVEFVEGDPRWVQLLEANLDGSPTIKRWSCGFIGLTFTMVIASPSCWGLFQNTTSIISVLFWIKDLGVSQSWWADGRSVSSLVCCVMLPVGPVLELSHVTGIWDTAQEVWDALLPLVVPLVSVTPMAMLSCCPTTPWLLHPHNHQPLCYPTGTLGLWNSLGSLGASRAEGLPWPQEQKGVTRAQPSQLCHRGQTKLCRC